MFSDSFLGKWMNNWFHSNVHKEYHTNQKSKRENIITCLSIRAVFVFESHERLFGITKERTFIYFHIFCDDRHFFSPESKFISTQFTYPYGLCSGVKVPKLLCFFVLRTLVHRQKPTLCCGRWIAINLPLLFIFSSNSC